MTPETFVKAQVAAFAYAEAQHLGGLAPMTAIACILRNRVAAGWFGGDWMFVVNDAAAQQRGLKVPIDLSNHGLRKLLGDVEDIFAGQFKDELTDEGLWWMDPTQPDAQAPPNRKRVAQVGTLWIFK